MRLKSLLFGSAAALMAVTGAQAAEPLEPIAEPVDYVRICDAFGTGFFYIPGTDTCLKIGGYVRAAFGYGHDVRDVVEAETVIVDGGREVIIVHDRPDRDFNEFQTRARGAINFDSRVQTDIGMIRTYTELWFTVGGGDEGTYTTTGPNLRQAFIQIANDWGTVTVGRAPSFFEFWESDGWADFSFTEDDAPLAPLNLAAVTFNLGGGVSVSLSLEDTFSEGGQRPAGGPGLFPVDLNQDGIVDAVATGGGFGSAFLPGSGTLAARGLHGGNRAPDAVANVRVDQAWGSAQIMGALHHIRGAEDTGVVGVPFGTPILARADDEPDTELGWAVGAGAGFDIPGTGISFNIQGVYADGAPAYATDGGPAFLSDGAVVGRFNPARATGGGGLTCIPNAGNPAPCALIGTDIETTEAWSVKAGIGGDLAPDWVFNLQGSFARVDLPDDLGAPQASGPGRPARFAAGPFARQTAVFDPATGTVFAGPVISSDYDYWTASGLVAWAPVSGFIAGIEVVYQQVEFDAGGDVHQWGSAVRVQKSF